MNAGAFIVNKQLEIAQELVEQLKIPPRPEALISVIRELEKKEPDVDVVVNSLQSDVSLSGAVLQVVNSPLFSLPQQVSSIQQGIMLLGLEKVASLVRTTAMKNALGGCHFDRFWDTASDVALIASHLAKQLTELEPDDAYTLGLFHECGIPLMMQAFPDYNELLKKVNNDNSLILSELEHDQYGTTHCALGYMLGRKWFLPEYINRGVFLMQGYKRVFNGKIKQSEHASQLLAVLLLARNISASFRKELRSDESEIVVCTEALDYFGLSELDFEGMGDALCAELEEQLTSSNL